MARGILLMRTENGPV